MEIDTHDSYGFKISTINRQASANRKVSCLGRLVRVDTKNTIMQEHRAMSVVSFGVFLRWLRWSSVKESQRQPTSYLDGN